MSNIGIVVEKDSDHPSILELVTIINDIDDDPIKVTWKNTRDETHTLRSFPKRNFSLFVPDYGARDRATASLGLPLQLEADFTDRAKTLLTDPKAHDWRTFIDETKSSPSPKYCLLKLVADSLRKGNRPALAEIMSPLLLDGIGIQDMDVLLRLKSRAK